MTSCLVLTVYVKTALLLSTFLGLVCGASMMTTSLILQDEFLKQYLEGGRGL